MLEDKDLENINVLKILIANASFSIKGDAVLKTASILLWLDTLEKRIDASIKESKKKGAPKIKELSSEAK